MPKKRKSSREIVENPKVVPDSFFEKVPVPHINKLFDKAVHPPNLEDRKKKQKK